MNYMSSSSFRFLLGLTVAGMGSGLLTTVFGLFHVQVFLEAYKLPLADYALGSVIFAIINTVNDLVGAWYVDVYASKAQHRSDWVGWSLVVFGGMFLLPFWPWTQNKLFHFVASMSCYDTLFSWSAILMGSIVSDDSDMEHSTRITFFAANKVVGIVTSFVVAGAGLRVFDTGDLEPFRHYLLVLVGCVCVLGMIGQRLMSSASPKTTSHETADAKPRRKLQLGRVVKDFLLHKNFLCWICMEMLLESQNTFLGSFTKTFVDHLVLGNSFAISKPFVDSVLSAMRPLRQVVGLLLLVPVKQYGYKRMYTLLFITNVGLSAIYLLFVNPDKHPYSILFYLVVYNTLAGAVLGAGFGLAMADMVLEMKVQQKRQRRSNEASLAGLFMGMNALFAKPMESFLPFIAGRALGSYSDFEHQESTGSSSSSSTATMQVLYYLLILPPIVFGLVQLIAWRNYDLTPPKVKLLKEELKELERVEQKAMTGLNTGAGSDDKLNLL